MKLSPLSSSPFNQLHPRSEEERKYARGRERVRVSQLWASYTERERKREDMDLCELLSWMVRHLTAVRQVSCKLIHWKGERRTIFNSSRHSPFLSSWCATCYFIFLSLSPLNPIFSASSAVTFSLSLLLSPSLPPLHLHTVSLYSHTYMKIYYISRCSLSLSFLSTLAAPLALLIFRCYNPAECSLTYDNSHELP